MKSVSFAIKTAFVLLLFAVISCTKTPDDLFTSTDSDLTVATAKAWFDAHSLYNSNARLKQTRFSKLTPDWNTAKAGKTKGNDKFIEIPLKASGKFKTVYSAKNNGTSKTQLIESTNLWLVIYTQKGLIKESIKEVRPSIDYAIAHKGIVNSADFTGEIFTWDWSTKLTGGSFYKNGVRLGSITPISANKNGKMYYCTTYTTCYYNSSCYDNYGQITVYGANSAGVGGECGGYDGAHGDIDNQSCSGWELVSTDSYTQCYDDTGNGNDTPSQGTGPNQDNSPTNADIVVDPNLNECFKGVVNNVTSDKYKNFLTKTIRAAYGDNAGTTNLTFKPGFANNRLAGYSEDEQAIVFDGSKLQDESNEFIATVVFHELTHAIIVEYRGGFLSPNMYDQHVTIFQSWVDNMKNALLEVYPNMSDTDALSLCLQGMDDYVRDQNGNVRPEVDRAAREKYGISLDDARANAEGYRTGSKGTKCNQ